MRVYFNEKWQFWTVRKLHRYFTINKSFIDDGQPDYDFSDWLYDMQRMDLIRK